MSSPSPPRRPRDKTTAQRLARRLRRWLLAGLILVAPAYITFLALRWVFRHLDQPLRVTLQRLTAAYGIGGANGLDLPGAGLVMTLLLLLAIGAIGSSLVMRSLVSWFEHQLDRIPLVRTLYSGVKQLLSPLADEGTQTFQKVVVIRYPDRDTYSLGFLIRPHAGTSPEGEDLAAVLVPTNHLHLGSVVLVPASRVHDVDLTAEEGLRFLVSMGAALDHPIVLRAAPPPSLVGLGDDLASSAARMPPPPERD